MQIGKVPNLNVDLRTKIYKLIGSYLNYFKTKLYYFILLALIKFKNYDWLVISANQTVWIY